MEIFFILFFGFILGIKHAFDADHIVAISTLISKTNSLFKSIKIAIFWGFGHTTTICIIGTIMIFLNLTIPTKIALLLELIVAFMLILLGIGVFHKKLEKKLLKINKNKKSFSIGLIHGLAGSAALILLMLNTITNPILAFIYLLIFGLASIIGMIIASTFIHHSFKKINNYLSFKKIAGMFSISLGIFLIYQIGIINKLFFI